VEDIILERNLKANLASEAIRKVDQKLYLFWNLVLADRRLHIVKESDVRETKKDSK
jgi:hypothetical protein